MYAYRTRTRAPSRCPRGGTQPLPFLSQQSNFAVLDVSSLPLQNVKLLWKFFYINICGFISRDKFLYETQVLDNSYLRFKVQHPTSDSTQITARGPKVPIEGPVPLDAR